MSARGTIDFDEIARPEILEWNHFRSRVLCLFERTGPLNHLFCPFMSQLARVPTRRRLLARYSLLVMVGTACLLQTLAFLFR
jgi:hypothetical protein